MISVMAILVLFTSMLFTAQVAAMSSSSIGSWLKAIGLEKYESEFRDNDITFEILPELTDTDLKEIGIKSLGSRKIIL